MISASPDAIVSDLLSFPWLDLEALFTSGAAARLSHMHVYGTVPAETCLRCLVMLARRPHVGWLRS